MVRFYKLIKITIVTLGLEPTNTMMTRQKTTTPNKQPTTHHDSPHTTNPKWHGRNANRSPKEANKHLKQQPHLTTLNAKWEQSWAAAVANNLQKEADKSTECNKCNQKRKAAQRRNQRGTNTRENADSCIKINIKLNKLASDKDATPNTHANLDRPQLDPEPHPTQMQ
jgi:hypothetical protein